MHVVELCRVPAFFFVDVFLLGFCQHLLLPAVILLALFILSGRLAPGYGLYRLVRHENLGKQFVVGAAFGVLLVKTLFVGYLLETRRAVNPHALGPGHALKDLLQGNEEYPSLYRSDVLHQQQLQVLHKEDGKLSHLLTLVSKTVPAALDSVMLPILYYQSYPFVINNTHRTG